MPTNEPMRFCSADSVHKFLLIQIHGDMIGGGGAECTRERREEGAAADIKFYKGYLEVRVWLSGVVGGGRGRNSLIYTGP